MQKKKVAIIHNTLDIGGIERSLINLLNAIDFHLVEIDLYILTMNDALKDEINKEVNVIFYVNFFEHFLSQKMKHCSKIMTQILTVLLKINRRMMLISEKFAMFRRYALGKPLELEYDCVFALNQELVQKFALKNINAKRKYSFYHHGNIDVFEKFYHVFAQFDGIIPVSEGVSELICAKYPTLKSKISVITNIIPKEYIIHMANLETVHLRNGERTIIVSCGRLSPEKGFDLAVGAAKHLIDMGLSSFCWYIIGDGKERKNLLRQINSLSLQKYVILLGWKRNPFPYIKACDIYVQPSRIEAYSIALREAQVLQKVVVATKTIGATGGIVDGVTGCLCTINDVAISEAIAGLLLNQYEYNIITKGIKNIDFNMQNFSALLQFYNLIGIEEGTNL